ncbi:DUF445 domain-containing protein [Clostridium estertheticum]|uniref:DUF445 domain-containing protein n=1 Tax=Clostridium estertheticum subsp. estertheticum TaxID=1552 RepID=A0A1J0GFR1_9CLOT|nr:DUF445 domain-containing protein [Clostridium estertheticum]APC39726.1 hypothetical protein A7L45_06415 [Clostridium estertheticum subsp. estertheticum]MBU3174362.1 DUF445 domain-containing protein [Clostridium estertheticum]MBZ9614232.1 DUF445 domain-containing protein [Clostridium estertheticum subsp. laramiense]WAG74173.1 DUF445 domain-containing protein [Clostridium estertheticum]
MMKNKKIADLSVALLISLVIIINLVKINFGSTEYLEMLSFIIEAALVGAIADWFAITALFKEPFLVGKIPIIASHTAIISKNRIIIVNAVANMVQNELLSEKILKNKIEEINIADRLIEFIDKNIKIKSQLYEKLIDFFIEKLVNIDSLKLALSLESNLKQKIEPIEISVYIDKAITFGVQSDEFKEIFNIILDNVIEYINREEAIEILNVFANEILKKESNNVFMKKIIGILESVNAINTSDITRSILKQANNLLINLKDEDDVLRLEIIEQIKQLLEKANTDDYVKLGINEWKIRIIKEISLKGYLNIIIQNVIAIISEKQVYLNNNYLNDSDKFEKGLLAKQDVISIISWIRTELQKSFNNIKNDSNNKKTMDDFIKKSIFKFIESKYQNVGDIVKQVLNNMDDNSLNNFVIKKAGNELHGIRINGCVVGALFGGFVFALTHLIYDFILPNIKF